MATSQRRAHQRHARLPLPGRPHCKASAVRWDNMQWGHRWLWQPSPARHTLAMQLRVADCVERFKILLTSGSSSSGADAATSKMVDEQTNSRYPIAAKERAAAISSKQADVEST